MGAINPAAAAGAEAYQAQVANSLNQSRDVQRQEFRPNNENDRSGESALSRFENTDRGEAVSVTLSFEARTSLDNPQSNFEDQARARAQGVQSLAEQNREAAISGGAQNETGDAGLETAIGAQTERRELGLDGLNAAGGVVERDEGDIAVERDVEAQSDQNALDLKADTKAVEDARADEQSLQAVAANSGGRTIPPGSQVNLVI